jgi:DNA-binding transcriptional MerR regulator
MDAATRHEGTGAEEPAARKVGELVRRTGMSVRALRYYDEIGLLSPSGRTDEGGTRLYSADDVVRLQQIRPPSSLGVTLREIGEYLDGSGVPLERVGRRHGRQAAVRRERLLRSRSGRRGARGRLHTQLLQLLRVRRGGHGDIQPRIPATIRDLTRAFEDIGADELVCWPTVAELNKVDWLAELVG